MKSKLPHKDFVIQCYLQGTQRHRRVLLLTHRPNFYQEQCEHFDYTSLGLPLSNQPLWRQSRELKIGFYFYFFNNAFNNINGRIIDTDWSEIIRTSNRHLVLQVTQHTNEKTFECSSIINKHDPKINHNPKT